MKKRFLKGGLMRYEIVTQRNKKEMNCLECAKIHAFTLMRQGIKVYIRDKKENEIIYGDYFKSEG